jgi:hypothetical protein
MNPDLLILTVVVFLVLAILWSLGAEVIERRRERGEDDYPF